MRRGGCRKGPHQRPRFRSRTGDTNPVTMSPHAPPGRGDRPREGHGLRKIHGPRPRFRSICPIIGPARGPPAIRPRAPAQGPARRPGRACGGLDRPFRRALARGARGRRGGAGKVAQGVGRRRRTGLSRAGPGAGVRPGREGRPRRPATATSRSSGCCSRWRSRRTARPEESSRAPASRRRISTPRSRRCARAARPIPARPRTPTTR